MKLKFSTNIRDINTEKFFLIAVSSSLEGGEGIELLFWEMASMLEQAYQIT